MAKEKPEAICIGYSQHDSEAHYECPICNCKFGSWDVFHNEKNENGTDEYCPKCKTELDGLS